MSDEQDKPTLTRKPLGLKRTVEAGQVQQQFSHGRRNTVVVEVKRRRVLGRPGEAAPAPEAEEVQAAPAPAPVPAPAPAPAPKPALVPVTTTSGECDHENQRGERADADPDPFLPRETCGLKLLEILRQLRKILRRHLGEP